MEGGDDRIQYPSFCAGAAACRGVGSYQECPRAVRSLVLSCRAVGKNLAESETDACCFCAGTRVAKCSYLELS